ncbi:MAG: hypothetical protein J4F49_13530, partial [Rhodobacteraceae bacterium]|nr:hypothetical protein [Paracoccaceae bacterium]
HCLSRRFQSSATESETDAGPARLPACLNKNEANKESRKITRDFRKNISPVSILFVQSVPMEEKSMKIARSRVWLAVLSGTCLAGIPASHAVADAMPTETSLSSLEYELLGRDELWTYRSLDSYSEAPFCRRSRNVFPPSRSFT